MIYQVIYNLSIFQDWSTYRFEIMVNDFQLLSSKFCHLEDFINVVVGLVASCETFQVVLVYVACALTISTKHIFAYLKNIQFYALSNSSSTKYLILFNFVACVKSAFF
jgi:hypothetical protein